jgi:hypothetical protein
MANGVWGDDARLYTTGSTSSFGGSGSKLELVAWNETTGTFLWNVTWGGYASAGDVGNAVWGDGARIFTAGSTGSFGAGLGDLVLVAWNETTGALLWNVTWGGPQTDSALSVWGDGARVFTAGYTDSWTNGFGDWAIVAWNETTGTLLWNQTWGGNFEDDAESVWGDGARLYVAGMYSPTFSTSDFAVVAWDPVTGTRLWNVTWGWAGNNVAFSIWGDGTNLYAVGDTNIMGLGTDTFAMVAWNAANGVLLWNTTWAGRSGGYEENYARAIWGDGSRLYTAGYSDGVIAGEWVWVIVAWNPTDGAFLWSNWWGGLGDNQVTSVWSDGSRLFEAGYTSFYGPGVFSIEIVAWDIHFTVVGPNDVTYVEGTSGNNITWNVSSATASTGTYAISKDGVTVAGGTWASGAGVLMSVDNLSVGSYTYEIVASDGFGKNVTNLVTVTVTPAIWGVSEWIAVVEIVLLGILVVISLVGISRVRALAKYQQGRQSAPVSENTPLDVPEDSAGE